MENNGACKGLATTLLHFTIQNLLAKKFNIITQDEEKAQQSYIKLQENSARKFEDLKKLFNDNFQEFSFSTISKSSCGSQESILRTLAHEAQGILGIKKKDIPIPKCIDSTKYQDLKIIFDPNIKINNINLNTKIAFFYLIVLLPETKECLLEKDYGDWFRFIQNFIFCSTIKMKSKIIQRRRQLYQEDSKTGNYEAKQRNSDKKKIKDELMQLILDPVRIQELFTLYHNQ